MRLAILGLLTLLPAPSSPTQQQRNRVVAALTLGMSCKQNAVVAGLDCTYRIENGLAISVLAAGTRVASFTVFKADSDSAYYVFYSRMHGCIGVTEGDRLLANLRRKAPTTQQEDAFISLGSGRIYPDWKECGQDALRR